MSVVKIIVCLELLVNVPVAFFLGMVDSVLYRLMKKINLTLKTELKFMYLFEPTLCFNSSSSQKGMSDNSKTK